MCKDTCAESQIVYTGHISITYVAIPDSFAHITMFKVLCLLIIGLIHTFVDE